MAGLILVLQLASGVFLAFHYCNSVLHAFDTVKELMTEVEYGYTVRYLHANGASTFFIVTYLHIMKGFFYGSYFRPRQFV
jgi:quinol-cytochrome oxidoreductase complex cytochrome b subunit